MFRNYVTKSVGLTVLSTLALTVDVERVHASPLEMLQTLEKGIDIACRTGVANCRGNGTVVQPDRVTPPPPPPMSAAERQRNMDTQSALNTFGFNAGPVDGKPGRKTRSAIRGYQSYMGYPVTGRLDDWQRQVLMDNWRKYNSGAGNAYPRTMAAVGARGLLKTAIDPSYPLQFGDTVGGAVRPDPGYNVADGTGGIRTPQPDPSLPKLPGRDDGEVIGDPIAGLDLPVRRDAAPVSAAARCELVVQTARIQGVVQASNVTDPNQALSEKFCEARGFAITQGQSVAAEFAVSEDELTRICGQIEEGFANVAERLPKSDPATSMTAITWTAEQLNLSDPETAADFGLICLGMGYRLDNSEMALAGAMTLVSAGHTPYEEIVGHHLREGFGVAATPAASVQWYTNAITALEQGAEPAFVPSTTADRIQIIRTALQISERSASLGQAPRRIPVSAQFPVLTPITK